MSMYQVHLSTDTSSPNVLADSIPASIDVLSRRIIFVKIGSMKLTKLIIPLPDYLPSHYFKLM